MYYYGWGILVDSDEYFEKIKHISIKTILKTLTVFKINTLIILKVQKDEL
jgi:hypothetical protein